MASLWPSFPPLPALGGTAAPSLPSSLLAAKAVPHGFFMAFFPTSLPALGGTAALAVVSARYAICGSSGLSEAQAILSTTMPQLLY